MYDGRSGAERRSAAGSDGFEPVDAVDAHFGWFARFAQIDAPASSAATRQSLGWQPTEPGLLDDLDGAAYFPASDVGADPVR
jgi:hypothetical protein